MRVRSGLFAPAGLAAAIVIASLALAAGGRAYQAEAVTGGGAIAGTVRFEGAPPPRTPVEISKDREVCGAAPHYDESLVVGADGGIRNAVVSLVDVATGAPLVAQKDVEFDQKGCEYAPHVLALPAGSTIDIVNSDGILHSVRTESKRNPALDMAQPPFKRVIVTAPLKYPELIEVGCDAHNWMHGWWFVAGNPYYAVTGGAGKFAIKNVPLGTYTIEAWQEKLGTQRRKVTVEAGKTATVDFSMSLGKQ